MRRFDTPAAPPGWAGQGAALLRLVDPTGGAIAWLAPAFGAACVGYAVQGADGAWRQALHTGSPRDLRAAPLDHGIVVLGPDPDGRDPAVERPWRFVERDPTAATCALDLASDTPDAPPARLRLDLTARLEDRALHLGVAATNTGDTPLPVALGLRLRPAPDFRLRDTDPPTFGGEDGTLHVLANHGSGDMSFSAAQTAVGSTALDACTAVAPGALLAPGASRRIALIVRLA